MDPLDLLDRHLMWATENDETLSRYRALVGDLRRTLLVLGVLSAVAVILIGTGVAGVVVLVGKSMEPAAAAGIAASGLAAYTAIQRGRRYLRGYLDRLRSRTPDS